MAVRRFRFRLQKVLEYREAVERRVKTELAALETERSRGLSARQSLLEKQYAAEDRLRELQQGELDPFEDALRRIYIQDLEKQVARRTQQITEVEQRMEHKRLELIQASRDRKVMERLRERAFCQFRAEQFRTEQGALDEMGRFMFVREKAIAQEESEP